MSRFVIAWAVGAAAVALVVMVVVGVFPSVGTGNLLDPWRGLGRTLAQARTWVVPGVAGVVGAVVGLVHAVMSTRRHGR